MVTERVGSITWLAIPRSDGRFHRDIRAEINAAGNVSSGAAGSLVLERYTSLILIRRSGGCKVNGMNRVVA